MDNDITIDNNGSSNLPKNINEVEIDMSTIDWNEASRRAIEFERDLESCGWDGSVGCGIKDTYSNMSDHEKLLLLREKLGGILGLAAKNDNSGLVSVILWALEVIDG